MADATNLKEQIEREGFALVEDVIDDGWRSRLIAALILPPPLISSHDGKRWTRNDPPASPQSPRASRAP